MRLAPIGAADGAAAGGVLGLLLVEPVLFAAGGAAGAETSSLGLNQWFLRQVGETFEPGRAALFAVLSDAGDHERAIHAGARCGRRRRCASARL
jgi:uncharacterized membrane protein